MNRKVWIIINVVAYIATLVMNFLAQAGQGVASQLFPYSVQELATMRAVFFLPANYVFGIWGLIYTAMGAYIIYQALGSNRDSRIHEKIGPLFLVSCIANTLWLVLFQNDRVGESTIAMLVLLASLIAIYVRLGIGKVVVSRGERWAVHFVFSVYLGWITVATVANVATALYQGGSSLSFLGISADLWTVIMMIVAAAVGLLVVYMRRDLAFAGVVVWALVGIYARPFTTDTYNIVQNQNIALVNNTGLVLAVIVLIASIALWLALRGMNISKPTMSASAG